jgi:hypothetical protein
VEEDPNSGQDAARPTPRVPALLRVWGALTALLGAWLALGVLVLSTVSLAADEGSRQPSEWLIRAFALLTGAALIHAGVCLFFGLRRARVSLVALVAIGAISLATAVANGAVLGGLVGFAFFSIVGGLPLVWQARVEP